jgi:hypothetical protein
MSHLNKYLKYKNKYIKLKNNIKNGGNESMYTLILNFVNTHIINKQKIDKIQNIKYDIDYLTNEINNFFDYYNINLYKNINNNNNNNIFYNIYNYIYSFFNYNNEFKIPFIGDIINTTICNINIYASEYTNLYYRGHTEMIINVYYNDNNIIFDTMSYNGNLVI